MSNNRKRNLKKLARNILSATALLSSAGTGIHAAETSPSDGPATAGIVVGGVGAAAAVGMLANGIYTNWTTAKRLDVETEAQKARDRVAARNIKITELLNKSKLDIQENMGPVYTTEEDIKTVAVNLAKLTTNGKASKTEDVNVGAITRIMSSGRNTLGKKICDKLKAAGALVDDAAVRNAVADVIATWLKSESGGACRLKMLRKCAEIAASTEKDKKNVFGLLGIQPQGNDVRAANWQISRSTLAKTGNATIKYKDDTYVTPDNNADQTTAVFAMMPKSVGGANYALFNDCFEGDTLALLKDRFPISVVVGVKGGVEGSWVATGTSGDAPNANSRIPFLNGIGNYSAQFPAAVLEQNRKGLGIVTAVIGAGDRADAPYDTNGAIPAGTKLIDLLSCDANARSEDVESANKELGTKFTNAFLGNGNGDEDKNVTDM